MNQEKKNKVSSLVALLNSIETDNQVYLWFTRLITCPEAIAENQNQEPLSDPYSRLQNNLHKERIILISLLFIVLISIAFKFYYTLLFALLLLVPLQKILKSKKEQVLAISYYMLTHDFDATDLPTKTLYQICEIYSRKYKIPSLVDSIYARDNLSRRTILFTFVFTAWIYPLAHFIEIFLVTTFSYIIIQALTRTSFFYNTLKN